MNPKIRFVIETLVLWILFCLPINLLTIYFSSVAPPYDHELADERSENASRLAYEALTANVSLASKETNGGGLVHNLSANNGEDNLIESDTKLQIRQRNETLLCYDIWNNDTQSMIKYWDLWISGVSLSVTGILGIIGNILTLITLICYENRNSFNKLLIYLTVVDLLLIITFILEFSILNEFLQGQPYWYRMMFPYFVHPLKHILLSLCIFLMVAVSSERCQAICDPLRERPSPRSYLLAVTLLALSLNARKFAEFKYDSNVRGYETTSVMEYPTYIIISNTWQEVFVTGLIPFVALLYCNIRIYCKIRESSKHEKYRYVGGHHHPESSQQGASGPQFEDHELQSYSMADLNGFRGSPPTQGIPHPTHGKRISPTNSAQLMENYRNRLNRKRGRFQWLGRCVSFRASNGSEDSSSPRTGEDHLIGKDIRIRQLKMTSTAAVAQKPRGFFLRRQSSLSSSPQSIASAGRVRETSHSQSAKLSKRINSLPKLRPDSRNGGKSTSAKGSLRIQNSPLLQLTTASDEGVASISGDESQIISKCSNDVYLTSNGHTSPYLSRKPTLSERGPTSTPNASSNCGEGAIKRTSLSFYDSKPSSTRGQRVLRKRHEKSVIILVLIVFVFLVCHSFRLGVQTFQTLHPEQSTKDHYNFCINRRIPRLNHPVEFVILNSFNNLFLVVNSSINFIVYCAVRKTFRKTIFRILRCQSRNVNSV